MKENDKKSEIRNTEDEVIYKSFFENSSEGIFRFEIGSPIPTNLSVDQQIKLFYENSFLAECNDTMARMYGFESPEKIVGASLNDFLPQDDQNSLDYLTAFVKNKYRITNSPTTETDKEGNVKHFLNNLQGIVKDFKLIRVWGTQRDITELRFAEEALEEKEKLYRTVVQSLSEGLLITDREDKIMYANNKISEMTGYPIEEMLGNFGYRMFFEENQWDIILNKNKDRFANIIDSYEIEIMRKDGSKFWALINGAPYRNIKGEIIGTIGLITDITVKKIQSKALKENEEKYRNVVNSVREVIFQTNDEGKFKFLNPFWTEMTGFDVQESLNNYFLDFIHADYKKIFEKELYSIIFHKKEFIKYESRILTKNEDYKWVEINCRLQKNDKGETIGTSGFISDLHDRKLAEEQIIKAKEEAEESNRLKTVFLAQMSHEIRTPLNIILSYGTLLEEEIVKKLGNQYDDIFSGIQNGGKRLMRTIDLILNMSLIQTGKYEVKLAKLNIEKIIGKLVNDFKSFAGEKKLRLSFVNTIENPFVLADEYTLTQAFENLIDNAIKYTEDGYVEIIIQSPNENDIIVEISDSGIGISEEYLPKLFEPFSQEDFGYNRRFEGNGLGLALTKKYISLNNADIKVSSIKGEGSVFTLIFKKIKNG